VPDKKAGRLSGRPALFCLLQKPIASFISIQLPLIRLTEFGQSRSATLRINDAALK
jgi:hypothetical protein